MSATERESEGSTSRVFAALGRWIAHRPFVVLALIAAVSAVAVAGIVQLRVNNSNDIFFVEDDPLLQGHRAFQKVFGSDEFVLVFLEGDVFKRPLLDAASDAVKRMEAMKYEGDPMFTNVLTPLNAPVIQAGTGSLKIGPVLKDAAAASDEELDAASKMLRSHPIYKNLIIRPDGKAAALVGTLRAEDAVEYQSAVANEMFALAKDPRLQNANIRLVGNPIFKREIDTATAKEAALFGTLAILVALLALFLLFRRVRQVAAALAVVVLSVLWTLGLMAALGIEMNVISIILPLIVVIMGLGDSVHIINGFRHQRFLGKKRREAVIETLPETGIPCLLTSITTAIGFLAMLTAPVAPLRVLGVFIAIGVMFCLVLSCTLVPAVLAIGDDVPSEEARAKGDQREAAIDARFNALFGRLADVVVGHAPRFALGLAGFAIVVGIGAKDLVVESHPLYQFREDVSFRRDVQTVDDQLGGTTSVEVVIDTGQRRGVWDPEFVRRLDAYQSWIVSSQKDVVGAALSLADLLREIRFALSGTRELPSTRAEIAQLLLLYESGEGDLRLVADNEGRRARMSVRLRLASNNRNLELERSLLDKAAEIFGDYQSATPAVVVAPAAAAPAEPEGLVILEADDDETAAIDGGTPALAGAADAGNAAASGSDDDDIVLILEEDAEVAADAGAVKVALNTVSPSEQKGLNAPAKDKDADDQANAEANATSETAKVKVTLAGTSQLFVHLAAYVVESQVQSFLIALAIIAVLMMLLMRSVALGLVVLLPNVLPIVCTYGFMGYTGLWVDYLTSTIAVGALGVAVDGTIHIGTRFRRNREQGMDAHTAAHDVMVAVGRALVVTSIVLVAGFLVLLPSMLASLATFGALMGLCLALALVFDLVMTPAVLAWLNPGGARLDRESAASETSGD